MNAAVVGMVTMRRIFDGRSQHPCTSLKAEEDQFISPQRMAVYIASFAALRSTKGRNTMRNTALSARKHRYFQHALKFREFAYE